MKAILNEERAGMKMAKYRMVRTDFWKNPIVIEGRVFYD